MLTTEAIDKHSYTDKQLGERSVVNVDDWNYIIVAGWLDIYLIIQKHELIDEWLDRQLGRWKAPVVNVDDWSDR